MSMDYFSFCMVWAFKTREYNRTFNTITQPPQCSSLKPQDRRLNRGLATSTGAVTAEGRGGGGPQDSRNDAIGTAGAPMRRCTDTELARVPSCSSKT